MSSIPGYTLEMFVTDIYVNSTLELERCLLLALSAYREEIEITLDTFDDEDMSWRTFRNTLIDRYEDQVDEAYKEWKQGEYND